MLGTKPPLGVGPGKWAGWLASGALAAAVRAVETFSDARAELRTEHEARIAFMRVAIESTSGRPSITNYYEDCMDNDHIEMGQTNTNHQLERQLRISFASDRSNVKTWAEIERSRLNTSTTVQE